MADFAALREAMVVQQIAGRGIGDERVLDALRAVAREAFVPAEMREFAYQDGPLPIEADQTISQPYIVALMIAAAAIAPGDRVLEIGAGSGYAAAVIGLIAGQVIAIERQPALAALAQARMAKLDYGNVRIVEGDGSAGLPEEAPFDAILVSASGPHVPEALKRQLVPGGTLVMPVGASDAVQKLVKVTRTGDDRFEEEDLGPVRFVPLIGRGGWPEAQAGASTPPDPIGPRFQQGFDPPSPGAVRRFARNRRRVSIGSASRARIGRTSRQEPEMRKTFFVALAALIGAGPVQARPHLSGEAELARMTEGRVAGKPVDCISLSNTHSSHIVDGTAIVYDSGGTIYVNRPRNGAESLNQWDVLVTRTQTSELCSIDVVQLYDSGTQMERGIVFLGEFVPYNRVPHSARAHD